MLLRASLFLLALLGLRSGSSESPPLRPAMYFSDTSRLGVPFAKDPSVVDFHGRFFLYYSLPAALDGKSPDSREVTGWGIGIASSTDLLHWRKVGELLRTQPIENNGIAAPYAKVIGGVLHLFYQTYGHGAQDAICHATSSDGVHFTKDAANPVYRPQHMPWSSGRAIDASIYVAPDAVYLYFATRDAGMVRQMIGIARAPRQSHLSAGDWIDVTTDAPALAPTLPWEQQCIEAPSVFRHGDSLYMLYAGAYNNKPQQIGVARSKDGVRWTRVSSLPLLVNGAAGAWNSSESGHPDAFVTGDRTFIFYQGNHDGGRTYVLSKVELGWKGDVPFVLPDSSGVTAASTTKERESPSRARNLSR